MAGQRSALHCLSRSTNGACRFGMTGTLFEMLQLEGAQAGLSWITILRKRENYRRAFDGFDPEKIARYTPAKIEKLMRDEGIVRNRLKIEGVVASAKAYLAMHKEGLTLVEVLVGLRRRQADRQSAETGRADPGGDGALTARSPKS